MNMPPVTIGNVVAVLVLILAVVWWAVDDISRELAILAGLLAIARLT